MYDIDLTEYGLHITFAGNLTPNQLLNWLAESKEFLKKCRRPFGVLFDVQAAKSVDKEVRRYLIMGQHLYHRHGMFRSVVVYTDPAMAEIFKLVSRQSGICDIERLINAAREPNWEKIALEWMLNIHEPREPEKVHSHLQDC